jgi:Ca2+-binding RTX toxin-like protein
VRIATRPVMGIVAAALMLTLAPPASAAIVEQDVFGNLFYSHEPDFDTAHDVVVEPSGDDIRIADANSDIFICTNPADCSPADCTPGTTPREVICDGGVPSLLVILGGLNDRIVSRSSLPLVACGGSGSDVISGGPGRDTLGGGAGRDELYGGGGNDNLAVDLARQIAFDPATPPPAECEPGPGAEGFEVLDGGGGRDQIHGGPGDDLIAGGDDDDSLVGYEGDDRIDGGSGADDVNGLAGADRLRGEEGGDFLFGGPGNDALEGGDGDDDLGRTIRYDADGLGGAATTATAVEEGDDRLDGGAGSDHLTAGPGARVFDIFDPLSVLQDGLVDRRLQSAAPNGDDVFAGGVGDDLVTYANRDLPVDISLDGVANDGSPGERDRVDADVERVQGGARADVLRADPDGAALFGDLGGDVILGGSGPDILVGGFDEGADVLAGAAGEDQLSGGSGDDELDGGAGTDVLRAGSGDDRVFGGPAVDGLEGGAGSDRLHGGAGADCVFGFALPDPAVPGCPGGQVVTPVVGADGADMLRGGPGVDRLAGGDGADMADYADRRMRVVVVLPGAPAVWAPLPLADEIAADVEGARGGHGHDLLVGNGADNVFDGGPGDDQVQGGPGVDQLRGGSGRDLIVARDEDPDAIRCGTKRDIALIDGQDELVAALSDLCERIDGGGQGGAGGPRVRPGGACVLPLRPPAAGHYFLLSLAASFPLGTRVDASSCPARVGGASLRRGAVTLRPTGGGRGLQLGLTGGSTTACGRAPLQLRRLLVEGGRTGVTVHGRELSATGRRARWTIVDGCRGTWVRVRSGRVLVSPDRRRPERLVRAGQSHLVPARASGGTGR